MFIFPCNLGALLRKQVIDFKRSFQSYPALIMSVVDFRKPYYVCKSVFNYSANCFLLHLPVMGFNFIQVFITLGVCEQIRN